MEKVTKKETTSTQIVTRSKKRQQQEKSKNSSVSSLPLDLIIEVLMKLPLKPIGRFTCVSKTWYSTIRGNYFTDLFLTRPCRTLFTFRFDSNRFFHSYEPNSSVPHNRASINVGRPSYNICPPPVHGLICFQDGSRLAICNPSTGQLVALPNAKTRRRGVSSFLGYDSVENVHKVLCMTVLKVPYGSPPVVSQEHQVLTLRRGKQTWRMIDCQHPHCPATAGLCKDGVIYYGAWSNSRYEGSMLVCFDVNLEVFRVVKLPDQYAKIPRYSLPHLVNYHGELALSDGSYGSKVNLWILKDVKKQEWSTTSFMFVSWKEILGGASSFRCIGTSSNGEIVFAPHSKSPPCPFVVVYYDPEGDTSRVVKFEGPCVPYANDVIVFLDHVESLMVL